MARASPRAMPSVAVVGGGAPITHTAQAICDHVTCFGHNCEALLWSTQPRSLSRLKPILPLNAVMEPPMPGLLWHPTLPLHLPTPKRHCMPQELLVLFVPTSCASAAQA